MKRSNLIKYGLTALSVSAALGLTSCATVPSGAGGNGATSTAQIQTTGEPGSPSATTTIPGTQLPAPDPAFGGVIKDSAAQSKPWWPPTVVPPRWLGTTGTCMPTKTGIFTITTGPPACRNTTATTAVGSPPANRRPAPTHPAAGAGAAPAVGPTALAPPSPLARIASTVGATPAVVAGAAFAVAAVSAGGFADNNPTGA